MPASHVWKHCKDNPDNYSDPGEDEAGTRDSARPASPRPRRRRVSRTAIAVAEEEVHFEPPGPSTPWAGVST